MAIKLSTILLAAMIGLVLVGCLATNVDCQSTDFSILDYVSTIFSHFETVHSLMHTMMQMTTVLYQRLAY